jgi:RHS repeat-associated protein
MTRTFRLTAVAVVLASLLPPVQGEELPLEPVAAQTASLPWEAVKLVTPGMIEPLVAEATGRAERASLAAALKQWESRKTPFDRSALTAYLAAHPQSPWAASIHGNLGLLALEEGRFTQAIADFNAAWQAGKDIQHPGVKAFVDRIGGELVKLATQLGHQDAVAALLPELEPRALMGAASEARTFAREGLWQMQNPDGTTFLCGPLALEQLRDSPRDLFRLSEAGKLTPKTSGYSLTELAGLAREQGQNLTAVHREKGAAVPVPSVVHWKSGHYAALLGVETRPAGRYYHVRDAALGKEYWISEAALDEEASGYFLAGGETKDWRLVAAQEGNNIIGAGDTPTQEPNDPPPENNDCDKNKPGPGMAGASVYSMKVSLALSDTPIAYQPPKGPAVPLSLHYNQREAAQPVTFTYTNLGPNWTFQGTAYIADNPNSPGNNVHRYQAGGGIRVQYGYNAATGVFTRDPGDQSQLVRVSANPVVYERHLARGGKEIYRAAQTQGATRKVFITQTIDPAGNTLDYHYDNQFRLTHLTDASGGVTTLEYTHADPLKITAIADPFGRKAHIGYDNLGRLQRITDVIGIVSQVSYRNASAFIERLDTPYGSNQFNFGESGTTRWLELTNAQGKKERVEFRHNAPGIAYSAPATEIPAGMWLTNAYLNSRNTFHWDAAAWAQYPGDYTKAEIKHWYHGLTNSGQTSNVLESVKRPLESRVWYNYPGQTTAHQPGTCDKPSVIGRVLPDGTTQLTRMEYNAQGNVTHSIDQLGRETQYAYAENGIDLIQIQQKTATGWDTLTQITWNNQHRPLTVKDAAGRITKYTYNTAGQLTSQTNALNQSTHYQYDAQGRLTQIKNALGHIEASYTYNAFGNLATETDVAGYTLAHDYDALNRRTKTTYPDGTTAEYTWDKLDLVSVKDRNGKITQYQHDATRRLTQTTDALRTIQYGYDEAGRLISLTDGNGHATKWERDLQGRIVAKVTPDGARTGYTFDSAGRRVTRTDALGQIRTALYASDDHLTGITYSNTINPTADVSFTWDAYYHRLNAMTDGTGTTLYRYMQAGAPGALKLQSSDGPAPGTGDMVKYIHDALSRTQTWNIGAVSEGYGFDALGRIISNKNSALGNFTYTYLGDTGQITRALLNGTPLQRNLTYEDNAGDRRLSGITHPGAARSYAYASLPHGLITGITETALAQTRTWAYAYDAVDRLQSAARDDGQHYDYALDAADNIQSVTAPDGTRNWAYDTGNKIAQAPYQYDANGNVIEDETRTYQWDAENRLIGIGYKAEPQKRTEFRYDGHNRRVAIIETSGTTQTETRYTWCGNRICQARDGNDQPIRYYFAEGSFRPTGERVTGERSLYARDHLGSVRDILDQTGNVQASYDYDPYGKLISAPGSVPEFGYAGMQYHAPSELYLTKYRAYDPHTGRWLSRDPIGEKGGINLYGYVGGNPVTWTDPSGLFAQAIPACFLNPACAAAASATFYFVGQQVVKGVLWCLNKDGDSPDADEPLYATPVPGSKPKNVPPGTVPIDQAKGSKGWDKDDVHGIKDGVGAGPRDWVGISPDGNVITGDHEGNAVDNGPADIYLP